MSAARVALVTGGGRGIGNGISLALAAAGCAVAVVYHTRKNSAIETVKAIENAGGAARAYACDVADAPQVGTLADNVAADWGSIDVLVNNAGITTLSGTVKLEEADWDRVMAVNLKGAYLCSRAAIPGMQTRRWGRIINMSSIAGQTGGAIGPHYAASKAGVIGLTRFMARELGPSGITVNAVAPSGVPTELLMDIGMTPSANRPVGRVGRSQDVAEAVVYLASDAASFVTGQVLGVSGGSFIG